MTTTQESLESLRLPELQVRYAEIIGEATRCPNRTFLIRRIAEALASQPAAQKVPRKGRAPRAARSGKRKGKQSESAMTTDRGASAETIAPTSTAPASTDEPAEGADPAAQIAEAGRPLRELTISELQQRYVEVVGRPTGSSHRAYLMWKIREAQKGRIPVGPRTRRSSHEPAADFKILPLRMEAELVERLDDARQRLGLASRMDLFRKALSAYLAGEGEQELAEALVPGA